MNVIKTASQLLLVFLLALFSNQAIAQNKAQKIEQIKKLLESKIFVFTAQSATPMSGSMIQLSSEYFFRVNKDSLESHLPYYGIAYQARFGSTESPLRFTSTDFSFTMKESKRGLFEISIRPEKPDDPDQISISVSSGGYATLRVISMNRQPISFYGTIAAPKPPRR